MELREEFARNLRKYRRQRQLSQEALANEAGIDRTYISSLERGVYSASVDMIEKLANVLSIEPAALLERKGTRHAFVVTEGFRDLLDIGYQTRPNLFELGIRKPELLYDRVCEISERIAFEGFTQDPRFGLDDGSGALVRATTGDLLRIIKPLDQDSRDSFSPGVTVGRGVKCLARAVWRQNALLVQSY